MATDINTDFDIGPLSWVQGEIDQSITHALESLDVFDPASDDPSPLQRARTYFRQAAGAIHMVGLDALQAYTDEIELQLDRLGGGLSKPEVAAAAEHIVRACHKLQTFLAELVNGVSLVPLSLFDEYEAMQQSRGVKISHPADLFCPDLSLHRHDDDSPRKIISPDQFPSFLIVERRLYERGLLAWLRGDIKGAEAMRDAAENIEVVVPQQTVRTFWWTTIALLDSVREEAIANTFLLKHLLARIDLQIRRLIDGGGSVAERLQRETLYFLAISAPVSERIREVQEYYQLKSLLPTVETSGDTVVTDTLSALRATREAQGLAAEVKNLWQRLMGGQLDQYPKFRDDLTSLRDKVVVSAYPEMQSLFASLLKGSDILDLQNVPESVAMEFATALLFAEDVFAQQGAPIAALSENIQVIRARIDAALSNRALPELDIPALAALSERAQNRLLLAQVAQDVQTNLRHMEQELDAFFRDDSKREGLAGLSRDGREISGALRILGLDNADRLLTACMGQIARYISPETAPDHRDFELLAESLSALGFYIEALEQQRPQREELILPLLERQHERQQRLGERPMTPEQPVAAVEAPTEPVAAVAEPPKRRTRAKKAAEEPALALSVEATVERDILQLQQLGKRLQQDPQAGALRRNIEKIVLTLGDDAKLVGNATLSDKIKVIQDKIEANAFADVPPLLAALTDAAPIIAAPSAETQRLMKVDASELDAELLDIYLQEAIEVLDGVRTNREQLGKHPQDSETLRSIRRAFHTLKGSGRMVGLTDLGELAYDVEKIHNKLLEKGYPATPAVLAMIDVAERDFRQWVEELIKTKTVSPDSTELFAAVNTVAHEMDDEAALLTPTKSKITDKTAQKKTLIEFPPSASVVEATTATKLEATPEVTLETVPKTETPEVKPPDVKPPEVENPETETPKAESSEIAEPVTETPIAETSVVENLEIVEPETNWNKWELSPPTPEPSFTSTLEQPSPLVSSVDSPESSFEPSLESSEFFPELTEVEEANSEPTDAEAFGAPVDVESLIAAATHDIGYAPLAATEDTAEEVAAIAAPQDNHTPDDRSVVSLELNMASSQEATVVKPHEVKPVIAVEGSDGSVSLEIDWTSFKNRRARSKPVAKPLPLSAQPAAPAAETVAADKEAATAASTEEVRIGDIVLSKVLFDLFTEESGQHWIVLNREQDLMQLDASYSPSPAMIRAAHTLAGTHLAVGFPDVARVAKALELLLIAVANSRQSGELVTLKTVPVIARAVADLRLLIDRILQREAFAPAELREAEAVEAEIEALQEQISAALPKVDLEAEEESEEPSEFIEPPAALEQVTPPEALPSTELITEELPPASTPTTAEPVTEPMAAVPAVTPEPTPTPVPTPTLTPTIPSPLPTFTPALLKPAPVARAVGDDTDAEQLHDELDTQLLPLFLEEGDELYPQAGKLLRQLRQSPEDSDLQLNLKRNLHTFKGSARMIGAMRLGELAHQMETRLAEKTGTDEAYFDALETDLDRIGFVFDRLRAGEANVAFPWLASQQKAEEEAVEGQMAEAPIAAEVSAEEPATAPAATPAVAEKTEEPASTVSAATWAMAEQLAKLPKAPPPKPVAPEPEEGLLRVSSAKIDRLVNEAGEIIIARTRAEGELRGLKNDLLELTNSVIRLRNHVRVIEIEAESQIQAQLEQMQRVHGEFDPLEFDRYTRLQELTRSIAEGVNDVSTIQQALLAHLDTTNVALLSQARVSRDVQQALFSVRTVPFSSVTERLYRILRMLSKELQIRANLEIEGAHHGLDRAVLERLVSPLEHLLRNALAHGIEPPEVRRALGKPETGEITIAVRQVGNEIVIAFSDDGVGLDPKRIHQIAIEKGFLKKDEAVNDAKLFELILQPGFTTSKKITQVSGRGLGTDIVRNEVVSLGGRVEVTSVEGHGTTFTLYLPLTVAVAQTVLIRATQNRSWAIPVMMVEQVEHVTEDALARMYEAGEVERRGRRYPFYYFDRLVERGDTVPEIRRYNAVIFLRTGQGQVAIHVDEMIGNQEVVIKNAGIQLARVAGLSSATILGDGEIVLIVNPIQLAQRSNIPPFVAETVAPTKPKLEEVAAPLVLIVDDSLTVRKVTSRLMTREGYVVETAKDGFEALQAVAERRPDVILLDIEMPKMDGFEFAKLMKGDTQTSDIPIIMITSRTADKHRQRAEELGVDAYLGKPYQEDELLEAIHKALAPTTVN
ncbi:MAG: Hpt domain-containing protein [Betaproteobacteria bacterium]|nr:Hpt domain-containing protein [Betaproteobacteria bacterium]